MAKLPKATIKTITDKVDSLFDHAKLRFLGPQSLSRKLYIGFRRSLSLPGIYETATAEEGGIPERETLSQLLDTAGNYLDAERHRAKAKVVTVMEDFANDSGLPGSDPKELEEKLREEVSDLFGELKRNVRRIVDTESQKARNAGQLDGIVRVNASRGIEDPTIFFVVVRDEHLCGECERLHMLENRKTPRVWKLSELSHSYHKRGNDHPSVSGLHPHCRCTLTTLLPGFGFNSGGYVAWKGEDHDEYEKQRG